MHYVEKMSSFSFFNFDVDGRLCFREGVYKLFFFACRPKQFLLYNLSPRPSKQRVSCFDLTHLTKLLFPAGYIMSYICYLNNQLANVIIVPGKGSLCVIKCSLPQLTRKPILIAKFHLCFHKVNKFQVTIRSKQDLIYFLHGDITCSCQWWQWN